MRANLFYSHDSREWFDALIRNGQLNGIRENRINRLFDLYLAVKCAKCVLLPRDNSVLMQSVPFYKDHPRALKPDIGLLEERAIIHSEYRDPKSL